jgi:hypothetical protein
LIYDLEGETGKIGWGPWGFLGFFVRLLTKTLSVAANDSDISVCIILAWAPVLGFWVAVGCFVTGDVCCHLLRCLSLIITMILVFSVSTTFPASVGDLLTTRKLFGLE